MPLAPVVVHPALFVGVSLPTMSFRRTPRRLLAGLSLAVPVLAASLPPVALAQAPHQVVLDAREALRKRDRAQLSNAALQARQHPLASWVEYWELTNRLTTAQVDEVEAFYARWPGTYVEDRLRNDWLLELGRRRDWVNFSRDYPRFRMNDDREVSCYALLTQHLKGQDVRDAARSAWFAQRELDDGCNLLASNLFAAGVFNDSDAWREARLSVEANRPRAARAAAGFVGPAAGSAMAELFENPARLLARKPARDGGAADELAVLALMRLAANEPQAAATQLQERWQAQLPPHLAALAWAGVAKQAALKLMPEAVPWSQRAWALQNDATPAQRALAPWSDDTLGWLVRAALRFDGRDAERWQLVAQGIDAMGADERKDPTWVYWRARAQLGMAKAGPEGDAERQAARQQLESIAGQMHFYGKLALEELGGKPTLPARPLALNDAEREAARRNPGLERALLLISIGLRNEGVREWNFTLRGMNDRELLGAAQLACDREVWDRCINTSDRTRQEVDMAQRFPMPFRNDVVAQARELGVDPAYVYGLIRQESRFIMDARSHVGASGLMQIMPATAKWTAKRIGIDYKPEMIADRDLNLRLGTTYLKLVLDDFGGSQALAAAAYNAGPGRPRRWREGPPMEPAAWAENIPFNETRDYVKKVLSNAVYYNALLGGTQVPLKGRLGKPIGPRDPRSPDPDKNLP
jgi:soluble lytic murein transglycosylase